MVNIIVCVVHTYMHVMCMLHARFAHACYVHVACMLCARCMHVVQMLPSMLCACCHACLTLVAMHVTFACYMLVNRPKTPHETCMLHECRKRLQHSFNMRVALRMLLSVRCM